MMKALRLTREDPSSSPLLSLVHNQPIPSPQQPQQSSGGTAGELLIKIHASAIQPADQLNAAGSFGHTTFPRTPGRDFSGHIVLNPDAGGTAAEQEGEAVFGTSGPEFSFTRDGAHAAYALVRNGSGGGAGVAPKPRSLTHAQAASLGTPLTTAALALRRAGLRPGSSGDVVMVLGANGGVGSLVVQLARARGCAVIRVARRAVGPEVDVDSRADPELRGARTVVGGGGGERGPDVVVDTVGDLGLVRAALAVMNDGGRLALITAPRGAGASRELGVDVLALYRRQISLVGCNSVAETQEAMAAMLAELGPLFDSGALVAPAEESLRKIAIEEAPAAYADKAKKAVIVF